MSLVIFDFDGTLYDSANTVLKILNGIRATQSKKPLKKNDLIPWISLGGKDLIKNSLEIEEMSNIEFYLDKFRKLYFQEKSCAKDIYPHAVSFLNQLKKAKIRIAICTNKPRSLIDKILAELSLAGYFDYVLAGGDLPTQKPNPENILICNKILRVSNENTILIGDSTIDQKMANIAGVRFCFYKNGYDDGVDLYTTSGIIESYEHSFALIKDLLSISTQ